MSFSVQNMTSSQREVVKQLGLRAWQLRVSEAPQDPSPALVAAHTAPQSLGNATSPVVLASGRVTGGRTWFLVGPTVDDPEQSSLLANYVAALGAKWGAPQNVRWEAASFNGQCDCLIVVNASAVGIEQVGLQTVWDLPCLALPPLSTLLNNPPNKRQAWQWTRQLLLSH